MKRKDLSDLRNKTIAELEKSAAALSGQISKVRLELSVHRAKNSNQAKNLRRNLAQTLTIRKEKLFLEK